MTPELLFTLWLCWCALLALWPSRDWDARGMILGDEG